jgi:hypothetical protein
MVKIINHGLKPLIRRIGTGANIVFYPGQEVEVTDEALIAELRGRKEAGLLQIKDPVSKADVGGGLKTGSRKPKSGSKAARKPKAKKEVKPKKPKGLKKPKRAD